MVEIPAPRINRDEYRTFSDEAFLQEVYLADFATRTFLTEKEERDRELSIRLRANRVITTPGPPFHQSRRTEIEMLLARGVFNLIPEDSPLLRGQRIFNSRCVDKVKGKETITPYEKSRLII